jgi:hypothetical protein
MIGTRPTVRFYSCAEYLQRRGFMISGPPIAHAANDRLLIKQIQAVVAQHFHIPIDEMWSARRGREIARPRQVAMFLATRLTSRSLPEIGRRFGNRDHTTVIHAKRQIEKLTGTDAELARDVAVIRSKLQSHGQPAGDWSKMDAVTGACAETE